MRHVLIALAIAGCGGHSGGPNGGAPALKLHDIAQACVNAFACLAPPIDGPTLPKCLRHLDDGDSVVSIYRPDQIRCLVAAGADCVAARACVGYAVEACSPDGDRCDGDRVVTCSRGMSLTLDCRNGLWYGDDTTCVAASSPACGIAACSDRAPARCDGSRVVQCQNGVLQAFDCAQAGLTCTIDSGGTATCGGTGAACTASRCDGTTLVRCGGGHEQRYACAAMFDGGMCLDPGAGGLSCGFGPDCGGTATCAGNVAQLCVLGAQVSIDCVASGFSSCALGSCIPAKFP